MQNCKTLSDDLIELYDNHTKNDKTSLIEDLLKAQTKYAMGRNELTKELNKVLKIDYIIDDFTKEQTFENIPIVKMDDVPKNSFVICSMFCTNTYLIMEKLLSNNLKPVRYMDLYKHLNLQLPDWIKDSRNYIESNKEKFDQIYNRLEDEKSKKSFKDVLSFRLTGNENYLKDYKCEIVEQYFAYADFLELKKDEVFVDCGGFDGDTSQEFIKRCPKYKKIFFFEPSEINIKKAKERLKDYKNIEYINKGCSNKEEVLSFNSDKGSASNISNDGDYKISLVKIDDYVKEPYTFIKMDLEGWELNALKGAEETIKAYKPKIAVTPYHNIKDFIELFNYILSLNPDYKVYFRHYAQGWSESVYFFI